MLLLRDRILRILRELEGYRYEDSQSINQFEMKEDVEGASWQPFNKGDKWQGYDQNFCFHTTLNLDEAYEGKSVWFEVITGREHCWDNITPQIKVFINDEFVQGLTLNHREFEVCKEAKSGDTFDILLHAHTGMDDVPLDLNCRIYALNERVEALYYHIKVIMGVVDTLGADDRRRIQMIETINQALNLLDLRRPFSEAFQESIIVATQYIEQNIYEAGLWHEETFAHCIGHTHIDVAWRWTVAESRQKAARSFATALNYMKDYPEYQFLQSQPQLYQFVKEDHPEIYEQVKQRVAEGRWEADGGMWVEADCNLISGESMVRQFLFGTRFFKQEFGVDNKLLWLPDVFGYSAAMPQILKKCGLDYFVTSKLSWNEYNKVPYDTFMWKGIDGTEILTHFIMTRDHNTPGHGTAYGGQLTPSQMAGGWERYQQKDVNQEILHPYGFGDGGGGPTREMLENARRMSKGLPGIPKVKMGKARDFLQKLEQDVKNHPRLPKWVGELYLEYHRGTYTSMAKNKKYNRQSEFLYQDVEWISCLNQLLTSQFDYPRQSLTKGWELILLNQFHDIIPGCSIPEVYEVSHQEYEQVIKSGTKMLEAGLKRIALNIELTDLSIVVFNPLSFKRSDYVTIELPEGFEKIEIYDEEGTCLETQLLDERHVLFMARHIPSKGYKAFTIKPVQTHEVIEVENQLTPILENDFFKILFNERGEIVSLYDKRVNREVLKSNERGNVLQAFEDKPLWFDAWDINLYYEEKMWEVDELVSMELVECGPIRQGMRIVKRFMDSTIEQTIYLYADKPVIDFKTEIDWHEHQILLKAAFPLDIVADQATYEIQYGHVNRPTHSNTSWDKAQFEVCAHRWADLSEGDYGVSLLNDCKYGYDVKEQTMRLTLLKSGIHPNPNADQGHHEFTYSLYPHLGNFKEAEVVAKGYELNCPLIACVEDAHEGCLKSQDSMIFCDANHVFIEVVKLAEDSDDIIVRLYEAHKKRGPVNVTFNRSIKRVVECDLLEREIEDVSCNGATFSFDIKPFEIKTFKLSV